MKESTELPENRRYRRDRIAFAIAIAIPVLLAFVQIDGVFGAWVVCAVLLPYVVCRIATRRIFLFALLTSMAMMIPFAVWMSQKDPALGFRFLLTPTGLRGLKAFWIVALFLSIIPASIVYSQRGNERA